MKVNDTELKSQWQALTWENFQELSLQMVTNKYKDYHFDEYLKKGNKQEGIDIISSIGKDQKYILVQKGIFYQP